MASTNKIDLFHALHHEAPSLSLAALQARVASRAPKYRGSWILTFGALALALGSVALILHTEDGQKISSQLPLHTDLATPSAAASPIVEAHKAASSASWNTSVALVSHSSPLRTKGLSVASPLDPIVHASSSDMTTEAENATSSKTIVDTNAGTEASSPKSEPHEKLPEAFAESSANANRIDHRSTAATASRFQFSGAIQAGVVMSSLNTTGGGLELEVHHDWQTLIIRYTTSFGLRRNGAELFRASSFTQHIDNSHQIVDIGLEVGATLRQGDFWATIAAGPNYTKASAESYSTLIGQPRTLNYSYDLQGVGGTAQANFGYKFSNLAGIALTGFVSNHTQTYGGILLSLIVGDLE